MKKITVIVHDSTGCVFDIQIPTNISADELINGLHIGLQHPGESPRAIRSENPIAYLSGERILELYDLRNGTELFFYRG